MKALIELARRLLEGTPGTTPPPCTAEVFRGGVQVMVLAGPRSWLIERYVVEARTRAGVPIDWHFCGGRAVVLALPGDVEKAVESLEWWLPAFEEAAREAKKRGDARAYEVQLLAWGGRRPPRPDQVPNGVIAFDADGGLYASEDGA
jgi:hypothetical protein